jgi:hypothetical protein
MKPIIRNGRYETMKFIMSNPTDKISINRLLGCNHNKIRKHIESQFQYGMAWENHGWWHIDHIKPLSTAKTEKDLMMRFRWQNIQPLWREANLRKKAGTISEEKLNEINNQMAERCRKHEAHETIRAKKNPNQLPIGQDNELTNGR